MEQRGPLNMDLPREVARAAGRGNVDVIRDWLATGGAPDAIRQSGGDAGVTLLTYASYSSRPSCASIAEILCAAGARDVGGRGDGACLSYATKYGAVGTVRVLLKYGASTIAYSYGWTALHQAVLTKQWRSIGHPGIVRLLLQHGAAVDARTTTGSHTPLMVAAKTSGFISMGVVRELLRAGASLDAVDFRGRTVEEIARRRLRKPLYTGESIPEHLTSCRRPGAVEAFLDLCAAVRAAGSWKRYANAPRIDIVVLQTLCARGRAAPPPALAHLFPTTSFMEIFSKCSEDPDAAVEHQKREEYAAGRSTRSLPKELVWIILSFWRTDRDP